MTTTVTKPPVLNIETQTAPRQKAERFGWGRATVFRSGAELRNSGPLASAYSQWADRLADDLPVLIALADPIHALAAFFGILGSGRTCGIASPQIASTVPDGVLHILDRQLQERDPRDGVYSHRSVPFITFTGGTTGAPKAILRQQSTWLHSFNHQDVDVGDRVAIFGDLTHSLACYAAIEALSCSADLYLLDDIRPHGQALALAEHALTVVYATPTQIKRLPMDMPCPDVRCVYIGGGALDERARAVTDALFPNAVVRAFYGSSETSFLTMADKTTPTGSVGKAFRGVDLKVDNAGHIWSNSPMLFDRYLLGESSQTQTKDGFLSVGDLGRFDSAGNLFLTGRADRTVSISDQSVQLDAVEQQIEGLSGIANCAVLAGADPKRGHHLLVAIQGDAGEIAALSLPKIGNIITLQDWPTLSSGKTDYRAIALLLQRDTT